MRRFHLCLFSLLFSSLLLLTTQQQFAQEKPIEIDLRGQVQGQEISPLLFGHNLEVTRKGFWNGISAQMIANRKFAATNNGAPKQWQIIGNDQAILIDTAVIYAGRQSLSLSNNGPYKAIGISQQHKFLAFKKDSVYVFRLWVKTASPRGIVVKLSDSAGRKIYLRKYKVQSGDWELLTSEFSVNSTIENCRIEMISSDPGQFSIGAVSLMPKNNFHGMRTDVVELLKKLQPGCLRFPGGCYAEFYTWKEGLLPVDKRAPIYQTGLDFLLRDTDDTDNHEIGIDEFISLCRAVGAEPIITARLSENTPQDAADWVSYCNGDLSTNWGMVRIERGYLEPFNVRWWFVGNELYSFGRGLASGIKGVSDQTLTFSKAMKAVDSTIKLVPCTKFGNGEVSTDWNTPLLNAIGVYSNAVTAHQYMLDVYPVKTRNDYSFLINSPESITLSMLRGVRNYVDTVAATRGKNVGITFDEWNTRWGLNGTVPMGLYAARMLNMLCREGEALGLSMACFFMPVNEGAIKVGSLTAELEPAGQVFDLFKVHQQNILLRIPNDPSVDICVSKTVDAQLAYLTLVNDIKEGKQLKILLNKNNSESRNIELVRLSPRSLQINETVFDRNEAEIKPNVDGMINLMINPGEVIRLKLWL